MFDCVRKAGPDFQNLLFQILLISAGWLPRAKGGTGDFCKPRLLVPLHLQAISLRAMLVRHHGF